MNDRSSILNVNVALCILQTISLGLLSEDANNFAGMVAGYYHIFVDPDRRLVERTMGKNTSDPEGLLIVPLCIAFFGSFPMLQIFYIFQYSIGMSFISCQCNLGIVWLIIMIRSYVVLLRVRKVGGTVIWRMGKRITFITTEEHRVKKVSTSLHFSTYCTYS